MRTQTWLGLLAVVLLAVFVAGCDHGSRTDTTVVVVVPGTQETFTLTLVNQTSQIITPGPVVAEPGNVSFTPLPEVPPGGTETVQIGFLPSSITVGATPAFGNPYPTHTLFLGTDYFSDATGATFIYQGP